MPLIIDSNGKGRYDHRLNKTLLKLTLDHLKQLYDVALHFEIEKPTSKALDKWAELYGFEKKHE